MRATIEEVSNWKGKGVLLEPTKGYLLPKDIVNELSELGAEDFDIEKLCLSERVWSWLKKWAYFYERDFFRMIDSHPYILNRALKDAERLTKEEQITEAGYLPDRDKEDNGVYKSKAIWNEDKTECYFYNAQQEKSVGKYVPHDHILYFYHLDGYWYKYDLSKHNTMKLENIFEYYKDKECKSKKSDLTDLSKLNLKEQIDPVLTKQDKDNHL